MWLSRRPRRRWAGTKRLVHPLSPCSDVARELLQLQLQRQAEQQEAQQQQQQLRPPPPLNAEQLAAVTHSPDQPLLVVSSGAGRR